MSSLSEIFLMHLKATALQSSDVSIIQDNANSSCNSLTKHSLEAQNSRSDSSFTTMTWSRPGRTNSRWEPAVAIDDDQPGIPTRQDSSKTLMSPIDDSIDSFGGDDINKDSQPRKPCRQSSERDFRLALVALPRIPRRQNSSRKSLGGSLHGSNHERRQQQIPQLRCWS